MICGIYRITNLIDGKVYIGQSQNIAVRWRAHKYGRPKDSNSYLNRAIAKHGVDSFLFEILIECPVSKLDEFERKYIAQHNSMRPNGYNLEGGGRGQKEVSTETRKKLRIAHLGEKNHNYGKPKSELTKARMSVAHSQPVNKYTRDGKYLETFVTAREAAISLGKKGTSVISGCCRGIRPTAYGYQWRFSDGGNEDIEPYIDRHFEMAWQANRTPVCQFTKNGVYLASYDSVILATKATAVVGSNIVACCKGRRKTAGGFVWKCASEVKCQ